MPETAPIIIDLNDFKTTELSEKDHPDVLSEVGPSHSLGFTLTPMEPGKEQSKQSGPGIPDPVPKLMGRLESWRVTAIAGSSIAQQSSQDQLDIGGPAARLDEEKISPGKDKLLRPSATITFWTYYFTEYSDLRVLLEVESSSRTPKDGWIQFFIEEKLCGKLPIGAARKAYRQEFRITGSKLPHEVMTITCRLASEESPEKWGHFLFNRAQIRAYEPQVAGK